MTVVEKRDLIEMIGRWMNTGGRTPNEVENERRKCAKELNRWLRYADRVVTAAPSVEKGPRPEGPAWGVMLKVAEAFEGSVLIHDMNEEEREALEEAFCLARGIVKPAPSPEAHARCPECGGEGGPSDAQVPDERGMGPIPARPRPPRQGERHPER